MPNTPRKRLLEAMAEVEEEYAELQAADGPYAHEMAVAALGVALQELHELLDSGLLDQAGSGGERTRYEPAFEQGHVVDKSETSEQQTVSAPTAPHPAPESVEGVVESIWQPVFTASATSGSASYQYRQMVAVPDDWPPNTRVRITRISE